MMSSESTSGDRRWQIIYRGRVQGVGFRATVSRIARRFPISGFVRNLSDGSVELVAEGEAPALQKFHDDIQLSFQRNIESCEVSESTAQGDFPSFRVR